MRILIVAIMALFALAPLSAQAATWACKGPGYACGKAKSSAAYGQKKVKKHAAHTKSHKKYSKKASRKGYKVAKKGKRTYTGGTQLSGKASYYWQPQRVASGGWFNPNAMTAAHKTLPFGTRVRVTNRVNGRSVVVRINDRGPYIAGRIIDLSKAAAYAIGMQKAGVVPVTVAVLN